MHLKRWVGADILCVVAFSDAGVLGVANPLRGRKGCLRGKPCEGRFSIREEQAPAGASERAPNTWRRAKGVGGGGELSPPASDGEVVPRAQRVA